MKPIWIALLALFSCGFVVLTPESRRELKEAISLWHSGVASQYDLKALHLFLKDSISANKQIDYLEVSTIGVGTKFSRLDGFSLRAGRWLFVTKDPKASGFELRALVDKRGWVVFVCERKGKTTFRVVKTYIDPFIQLCPPPYSFSP